MISLSRELNGNVVLRAGKLVLRFFRMFGGAPLEWWSEPNAHSLTNSYPGSGVSACFETGQDPTQASANGQEQNPICCFGIADSQKYNYYARESLYDGNGAYEVTGFAPDFWLSAEKIDDYQMGAGWRTKYVPGPYAAILAQWTCPVIFAAGTESSGYFAPGNEMEPGFVRGYPQGRIAFKVDLSLATCGWDSIAGFVFRKQLASSHPTKDEVYNADGLHLNFNKSGAYQLIEKRAGKETVLLSGTANAAQKAALLGAGLTVEIRTNNVQTDKVELFLNDALAGTASTSTRGEVFALFASATSGFVLFCRRQVFDLGVTFAAKYRALAENSIESDIRFNTIAPRKFYRAGHTHFFNPLMFPARSCQVDGQTFEGITPITPAKVFYCGNRAKTVGLNAQVTSTTIDNAPAPGAHSLLQQHGANDEFIMAFNLLPQNATAIVSQKMQLITKWVAV